MTYNIVAIFNSVELAQLASKKLLLSGYFKAFRGYYLNTKIQPESLIEDHYLDTQTIHLYTPNINRAYKALRILYRFSAKILECGGLKLKVSSESKSSKDPITCPVKKTHFKRIKLKKQ